MATDTDLAGLTPADDPGVRPVAIKAVQALIHMDAVLTYHRFIPMTLPEAILRPEFNLRMGFMASVARKVHRPLVGHPMAFHTFFPRNHYRSLLREGVALQA